MAGYTLLSTQSFYLLNFKRFIYNHIRQANENKNRIVCLIFQTNKMKQGGNPYSAHFSLAIHDLSWWTFNVLTNWASNNCQQSWLYCPCQDYYSELTKIFSHIVVLLHPESLPYKSEEMGWEWWEGEEKEKYLFDTNTLWENGECETVIWTQGNIITFYEEYKHFSMMLLMYLRVYADWA